MTTACVQQYIKCIFLLKTVDEMPVQRDSHLIMVNIILLNIIMTIKLDFLKNCKSSIIDKQ